MYHLSAIVTCLAVAFYFFTSTQVARARAAFGIKAPAITGHPDFERANEHAGMDGNVPALAVVVRGVHQRHLCGCARRHLDRRPHHVLEPYKQAANKRSMGFAVQSLACFALWLGTLGAIGWRIAHT